MTYVKPLDIPVKNKVLPSLLTAMLLALPGIIKAQVDLTEMPKKTGVWKYVYEKRRMKMHSAYLLQKQPFSIIN